MKLNDSFKFLGINSEEKVWGKEIKQMTNEFNDLK